MKAALLYENNKYLKVENIAIPKIRGDEVLVKIKACGVCHTDLHYIDHGIKTFHPLPLILGHESSGIIEKVGEKVKNFSTGNRVLIPAVLTCGECKYCLREKENICSNMQMLGNHINGAYAEYIAVKAKDLQLLPDIISFKEAALISDAISTGYHAVINRAKVKKNDTVVILGCGGVGISILQICKLQNARIIAVDINEEKLELAKNFGATHTINISKKDVFSELKSITPYGIDVIFEVVGLKSNFELAIKLAKPATKICIVGYISEKASINCAKLMFFELDIIGSLGCRIRDYQKIINLVASGKIDIKNMINNNYKIENINDALEDLRQTRGLRPIITFE